jgi:hypothetical protein
MQKVVIDTNVIISALIGSSYPQQILFDLVLGKKVIVCMSLEVFTEYVEVLNREKFVKYPGFVTKAEIVINKLEELSIKYIPSIKLDIIKDAPDNRFLELGVTANADFLITGNTNDFRLDEYAGMKIVTPEAYIKIWHPSKIPKE